MFISDSVTGDLIALLTTILVIFITYSKWIYQYWKRQNVPYLEPQIPFGNFGKALRGKEHIGIAFKKIYDEMKRRKEKFAGIYTFITPNFFPIHLDMIRDIIAKDFQYFSERNLFYNEKEPLQAHLANLSGVRWKNLRAKLTPTFTSGKMKMMFGIMEECQNDLQKKMEKESNNNRPINIKEIVACFTTNIIGSCAFGLDCKALEDEDSEFRKVGKMMFEPSKLQRLKQIFAVTFPNLGKLFSIKMISKEVTDFMLNVVEDTINHREKNNYTRNDFMQLLINLKNNAPSDPGDHDGKPLTLDEVASQALVFFGAGFETSSTLMTFTLYELAKQQEIQDKLRDEVKEVLEKHNNQISYDSIQSMTYLSQVIDESLRIHPPVSFLSRRCVKDYKVPNTEVVIKKGTSVFISILGIHYDEEYYPYPKKFDPERFNDENKQSRLHFTHIPFGGGPRNCIGLRFGLLQAKVGLVSLLKNFRFTVNQKTSEPLVYNPGSSILSADGEIWLNAKKL